MPTQHPSYLNQSLGHAFEPSQKFPGRGCSIGEKSFNYSTMAERSLSVANFSDNLGAFGCSKTITGEPINLTGGKGCLFVGNPGIGKSTFLVYVLAKRLSRAQPTLYYDGVVNYFDETGAYTIDLKNNTDYTPFLSFDRCLCLINFDIGPLPPALFKETECLFPVLVSSPKEARCNDSTKYVRVQTIVGKPPSFTEALEVWGLLHSNPVVTARRALLQSAWDIYGPNLRLGPDILEGESAMEHYHKAIENTRKDVKPTSMYRLLI
ncbi:hypothetical protein GYMLUDRAFT_63027 [Collybiopsis luxurians FD-317 M1]|uniref:Uncharacterized protein n=1 Tax=Collybiopsis luxurians FD-317 M1 TaxID=944289 RepID=A0A0D0CI55_9AGAR|nr:hypothetical protein GYMLUDRAFT_63027 [Collybiopsis luxurians FD-317 M1]